MDMKKYPIYYQGKEYEVRWERETYCGVPLGVILIVYEVLPRKFFKYKKLDEFYVYKLNDLYDLKAKDEDLYIKQAMSAVKLALQEIEIKKEIENLVSTQEQKLAKWNGVIE